MLGVSGLLNSIMIFVAVKETLNRIKMQYEKFNLRRDITSFI